MLNLALQRAEWLMWCRELETERDWTKRRIAAERVIELFDKMHGTHLKASIMAVWLNGTLRIPPTWPEVDVVPVGGGDGLLTVAVRSVIAGLRREVKVGIPLRKPGEHGDAIAEAMQRGRWELRKWA